MVVRWTPMSVAISASLVVALAYAGYRRGKKIRCKNDEASIVLPVIGWSLLGPMGPGYLVGRLAGGSCKLGGFSDLPGVEAELTYRVCKAAKKGDTRTATACRLAKQDRHIEALLTICPEASQRLRGGER